MARSPDIAASRKRYTVSAPCCSPNSSTQAAKSRKRMADSSAWRTRLLGAQRTLPCHAAAAEGRDDRFHRGWLRDARAAWRRRDRRRGNRRESRLFAAQFLNPRVNLRDDAYGGGLEGRLRFLREVIADIRSKVADGSWSACAFSGSEIDEQD